MASVMYILSLAHWALSLHFYVEWASSASPASWVDPNDFNAVEIALLVLFSLNVRVIPSYQDITALKFHMTMGFRQ